MISKKKLNNPKVNRSDIPSIRVEDFFIKYKTIILWLVGIVSIILITFGFIKKHWDTINIAFYLTLVTILLIYGNSGLSKNLVFIYLSFNITLLGTYLLINGTDYVSWYYKYDVAAHFLMGIISYHAIACLFPGISYLRKFFFAMLIEFFYELAEQGFGTTLNLSPNELYIAGWNPENIIQDVISNFMGVLFAIFIDTVFFPRIWLDIAEKKILNDLGYVKSEKVDQKIKKKKNLVDNVAVISIKKPKT